MRASGERIDALARALSSGLTRRQILLVGAVGLLGGSLPRWVSPTASAADDPCPECTESLGWPAGHLPCCVRLVDGTANVAVGQCYDPSRQQCCVVRTSEGPKAFICDADTEQCRAGGGCECRLPCVFIDDIIKCCSPKNDEVCLQTDVGGECCPRAQVCGDQCCPPGYKCEDGLCVCPVECGPTCCAEGEKCVNDRLGKCCPKGTQACYGHEGLVTCCDPGTQCCPLQTSGGPVNSCCERGSQCKDGHCVCKKGNTLCGEGAAGQCCRPPDEKCCETGRKPHCEFSNWDCCLDTACPPDTACCPSGHCYEPSRQRCCGLLGVCGLEQDCCMNDLAGGCCPEGLECCAGGCCDESGNRAASRLAYHVMDEVDPRRGVTLRRARSGAGSPA